MKKSINLEFYSPEVNNKLNVWLSEEGVSAGFPSPANDFKELRISLDKVVVKNEAAPFYARVVGQSMIDAGIDDGDLIVIDKSLEPKDGKIAVCFIDGEFTVKRLKVRKGVVWLVPENKNYKPLKISDESELIIWGIVTHVLKSF